MQATCFLCRFCELLMQDLPMHPECMRPAMLETSATPTPELTGIVGHEKARAKHGGQTTIACLLVSMHKSCITFNSLG